MTTQAKSFGCFHCRQHGFSLMELLISMSVMIIVMGAVFMMLGRSMQFANITYHMTDAEQSLRTSQEMIQRDLTNADGIRGVNMIKVPLFFVQNYLTRNPVVDPNTPNYPNLGLITSDDNVTGSTAEPQSNPAKLVMGGSDRTTVLSRDGDFTPVSLLAGKVTYNGSNTSIVVPAADIGRFQAGEIYAIASGNSIAFGVITTINAGANTLVLTNGDVFGINETGASAPLYIVTQINSVTKASQAAASIIRLQIIHYFLSSDKLLMRRVFGIKGAPFVDSVIAEHVVSLSFRYLLNTSDPNGFVSQPVAQLNLASAAGVREVESTVIVETARPVLNTNSNGGYQQIRSSLTTTMRNLQFREAL